MSPINLVRIGRGRGDKYREIQNRTQSRPVVLRLWSLDQQLQHHLGFLEMQIFRLYPKTYLNEKLCTWGPSICVFENH